ncbi:5'/3'-nucleotidase SurE [Clostridium amazonitimonense]|uniref:5'/3'-nucleotidase SurE n=1 Tax=Clostridium amazonitimonense TaxID=1499689 RepID=UPI0005094F91|nr:5'/3'-nucleotidase SurE [Clostridium amazonitimonense]
MRILITNDDGIDAEGIYAIAEILAKKHEVFVVAPHSQRSASSHSITLNKPLIIKEVTLGDLNVKAYSISGTPADCVRVGIDMIIKEPIDLVVSGINKGLNVGTDVLYSGTVSAAVEAALYNIPSIAISKEIKKESEGDYCYAAEVGEEILNIFKDKSVGNEVVINVNVPYRPKEEVKGFKVCKVGKSKYKHNYVEFISEDGSKGYRVNGEMLEKYFQGDDVDYLKEGYVTITPLRYDLNNADILKGVKSIID